MITNIKSIISIFEKHKSTVDLPYTLKSSQSEILNYIQTPISIKAIDTHINMLKSYYQSFAGQSQDTTAINYIELIQKTIYLNNLATIKSEAISLLNVVYNDLVTQPEFSRSHSFRYLEELINVLSTGDHTKSMEEFNSLLKDLISDYTRFTFNRKDVLLTVLNEALNFGEMYVDLYNKIESI